MIPFWINIKIIIEYSFSYQILLIRNPFRSMPVPSTVGIPQQKRHQIKFFIKNPSPQQNWNQYNHREKKNQNGLRIRFINQEKNCTDSSSAIE